MEPNCYLGIDVSKAKFDVALLVGTKCKFKHFSNDPDGFKKLLGWLSMHDAQALHACMEATAGYGDDLAYFLHEQGFRVSVVNPARIWGFRKSENIRTKTDKVDAGMIARFCKALNPAPWTPPAPEYRELKDIVRHIATLTERLAEEKTRLKSPWLSPYVKTAVQEHIRYLDTQIKMLKESAHSLAKKHPTMRKQIRLLCTIPGIGEDTAYVILGEVFGIGGTFHSSRSLVCYAGLSPRQSQSGSSLHKKACLSKIGNARLRKALYWPAITVWRDRGIFPEFCEAMEKRGKPKMVIIGALMRKLLSMAWVILKTGRAWNANWNSCNYTDEWFLEEVA